MLSPMLQKERNLTQHALAVVQARIAFLVAYSPPTLNLSSSKLVQVLQHLF